MASKARPGQSDITAGVAVSPPAAAHINRLINARARAAGVTPAQYMTGLLSGKFPALKPEEIAAINLARDPGQAAGKGGGTAEPLHPPRRRD